MRLSTLTRTTSKCLLGVIRFCVVRPCFLRFETSLRVQSYPPLVPNRHSGTNVPEPGSWHNTYVISALSGLPANPNPNAMLTALSRLSLPLWGGPKWYSHTEQLFAYSVAYAPVRSDPVSYSHNSSPHCNGATHLRSSHAHN